MHFEPPTRQQLGAPPIMCEGVEPYTSRFEDIDWNMRPQHRYSCSRLCEIAGLGKVVCANGSTQYKSYCMECGGRGGNLLHSDVAGLDQPRIPILSEKEIVPCERCGSMDGSEVHHWAPMHLFDDAEGWPKSHLCISCHREWHAKVTPYMSQRKIAA
jgi:hypothetical protein